MRVRWRHARRHCCAHVQARALGVCAALSGPRLAEFVVATPPCVGLNLFGSDSARIAHPARKSTRAPTLTKNHSITRHARAPVRFVCLRRACTSPLAPVALAVLFLALANFAFCSKIAVALCS